MGTLAGGKEMGRVWRAPLGPLFCPLAPRSLQLPRARTDGAAGCLTTTRSRPHSLLWPEISLACLPILTFNSPKADMVFRNRPFAFLLAEAARALRCLSRCELKQPTASVRKEAAAPRA